MGCFCLRPSSLHECPVTRETTRVAGVARAPAAQRQRSAFFGPARGRGRRRSARPGSEGASREPASGTAAPPAPPRPATTVPRRAQPRPHWPPRARCSHRMPPFSGCRAWGFPAWSARSARCQLPASRGGLPAVRCDAVGPGRAGGRALPCRLPPLTQPSAGGRLAGQAAPGDGGSLAPGPRPFFSRVTSAESGIPWASVSPSEVSRRPCGRARSQDLHPHREEPSAQASQKMLPPRPPARAVRALPVCTRRVRDTGPQDAA